VKRIGDDAARAELECDPWLAVDLRKEDVADRGVRRVERRQPAEELAVVRPGAADRDVAPEQVLVQEVAGHRVLLSRFRFECPMLCSTGTGNQGQFNANF
jgi:hypothetical protein